MLWDTLLFILGIAILVIGAELLVRGGSAIAAALGMHPLVIGLTVVAVGTSAPELVVSVTASATGHTDVALGNVIGSNVLNTFIVLGITAMLYPVVVHRDTVRKDLPIVILASLFTWMIAADGVLSRLDGFLLISGLVAYLHNLYVRQKDHDGEREASSGLAGTLAVVGVLAGIILLVIGGDLVVDAGTRIAVNLGIPERVIALTLVAFGTSAPELATSIVAAVRRQVDLAVGNVVGSNLLNLFLVLGGSAVVRNIPVPNVALWLDLPFMALGAIVLVQFASSRFHITRVEGGILVALYGGYLAVLLSL